MKNININDRFIHYIYDWDHYEYFLLGGYASSKSYNTAIKIILKAAQESRKFLVVRDTYSTMEQSCYADLVDAISILGMDSIFSVRKSPLEIRCVRTKSKIIFRGMDKVNKIMSIKDVSVMWIEEGEGSRLFYDELKSRLRTNKNSLHMIVTTNPKPKRSWVYQRYVLELGIDEREFYKRGYMSKNGVYLHHSTYKDNLNYLPQTFVDTLLATKDPRERKIKVDGEFGSDGLKAFYNLVRAGHEKVMKAVRNTHLGYTGMDFGFSISYNAIVKVAIDKRKSILYVYDEYYKNKMTEKQVCRDPDFQKIAKGTLVRADSEDPKAIAYYNGEGYNFRPVKKGAGSKLANIKKLRNFNKIVISDKCKHTWNELDGMEHKKDRWGEPIDTEFNIDAHTKDAIAYAIKPYRHTQMKNISRRKPRGW